MDFTSSLIETGRKFENGTYLDSLGNYMAMACLSFLYMTVYQILACKL